MTAKKLTLAFQDKEVISSNDTSSKQLNHFVKSPIWILCWKSLHRKHDQKSLHQKHDFKSKTYSDKVIFSNAISNFTLLKVFSNKLTIIPFNKVIISNARALSNFFCQKYFPNKRGIQQSEITYDILKDHFVKSLIFTLETFNKVKLPLAF